MLSGGRQNTIEEKIENSDRSEFNFGADFLGRSTREPDQLMDSFRQTHTHIQPLAHMQKEHTDTRHWSSKTQIHFRQHTATTHINLAGKWLCGAKSMFGCQPQGELGHDDAPNSCEITVIHWIAKQAPHGIHIGYIGFNLSTKKRATKAVLLYFSGQPPPNTMNHARPNEILRPFEPWLTHTHNCHTAIANNFL